MIDIDVLLWRRFEHSGNIDDYLTYVLNKSDYCEKGQTDAYYD